MLLYCASLLSRLPLSVHYWIADRILYPLIYYIVRYRRRMVEKNLRNAFPDKTDTERRQIARAFYHHLCNTFVETIYGYRCSAEEMRQRVDIIGMDEVNRQVTDKGGVIFMLAHYGNWEWLASVQAWLQPGVTELNVYRQQKNQTIDRLMTELRSKRGGKLVEKKQILREMIRCRAAKQPVTVGLICDQKPRPEVTRTWTTFLQQETGFLDGGEMLAKKFGYPVYYPYITCSKRGYYHIALQVITLEPQNTSESAITTAYARALEQNIIEQPELWLWSHNRFKWKRNG